MAFRRYFLHCYTLNLFLASYCSNVILLMDEGAGLDFKLLIYLGLIRQVGTGTVNCDAIRIMGEFRSSYSFILASCVSFGISWNFSQFTFGQF